MILIQTFFYVAGSVIFETKVSALFWAVFLEEPSVETMTVLLPSAQYLYEELMLTPYMARYFYYNKQFTKYPYYIAHQFLGLLSCTNLIVRMPGVILSGSYVSRMIRLNLGENLAILSGLLWPQQMKW
jgi:hypothetical protein